MAWSGVVGIPSLIGGLMVVGFGRASLWVGKISWSRLSSLQVGEIVSDFGMISGVVIRLSKICFPCCFFVLPIGMLQSSLLCLDTYHPFLVSGTSPLSEILMIGNSLWLFLFLNSFTSFFREVIGWIPWFGSFGILVNLMLAPSIVLYKGLTGRSFHGKAFGVSKLLVVFLFSCGQRLEVKF